MKKFLSLIIFVIFAITVQAQTIKPYYFYTIVKVRMVTEEYCTFSVLWDDKSDEHIVYNQNGSPIAFKSVVGVINYLSKLGWDYVDAIAVSNTEYNSHGKTFQYVMRKQITKSEEAKKGIYFADEFNK